MSTATANRSENTFDWPLWPETEALVAHWVAEALGGNGFAARLAERMREESNTRFADWLDHLVVSDRPELSSHLTKLGYARQTSIPTTGGVVYAHDRGIFPRVIVMRGDGPEVREAAIKVESVCDFSRAHDLGPRSGAIRSARTGSDACRET